MRALKAILGAVVAIVGFWACLAGFLYLMMTQPEHFPEPAAAVVAGEKTMKQEGTQHGKGD